MFIGAGAQYGLVWGKRRRGVGGVVNISTCWGGGGEAQGFFGCIECIIAVPADCTPGGHTQPNHKYSHFFNLKLGLWSLRIVDLS